MGVVVACPLAIQIPGADFKLMKLKVLLTLTLLVSVSPVALGQDGSFNGIGTDLGNLYRMSDAKSYSISPENFTGEKGKAAMAKEGVASSAARELGQGWKMNPYVIVDPGKTFTLGEITGSGAIEHIWMTPAGNWRHSILRMYWDEETEPSIEVPVGDFFAMGWGQYAKVSSLPVVVNPASAFNCYWPMPFRHKAKITMENLDDKPLSVYYQIDFIRTEVPKDAAYFHAQFRRVNPLPYKYVYTLVDNIKGRGQYVGTYMAWGVHNNGWWGEGEIKFYIDGDKEFPTIAGTGTEDYFNGSYDFEDPEKHEYVEFSGPYSGLVQVLKPDGLYKSQERFGLYRWHIADPVRFNDDLRVTIQALGWQSGGRYLPLQDDISSVVYWYQTEPHGAFPKLPAKDSLDIN